MPVHVTLHIFSGRKNPTWTLDEQQEEELDRRIGNFDDKTTEKPPGVLGTLGYRGVTLLRTSDPIQGLSSYFINSGIVDLGQAEENLKFDNTDLEKWLVTTNSAIEGDLLKSINSQIDGPGVNTMDYLANRSSIASTCPPNTTSDAPTYQPGNWNIPTIQPFNNCYNYANNNPTNTFAQPGRAHGSQAANMACPDVTAAAQADGLASSPGFAAPLGPGAGWYVALVVWPGVDYHWYRQDQNGCWSHKPGQTAVRNVDNSGNSISDPQTCNRGPYTDFCGYMITRSGLVIS